MLEIESINVYYSELHVLKDVSLVVNDHEFVSVIGGNGAGKSPLLNSIGGHIPPKSARSGFEVRRFRKPQPIAS